MSTAFARVTVPPPERDMGQTEVTIIVGKIHLIVATFERAEVAIRCAAVINAALELQ